MLSRSTSQRHHHHRTNHHSNFPPREYTDLSKADIDHLAPILAPLPIENTSAAATYHARTRDLIAGLPSHLRARIPKLSTFCKLHDKLSPLPIIDFLDILQKEITPEALEKWHGTEIRGRDLENANSIWMKPDAFVKTFGRAGTWDFQDHKCAACKLACLARNPDLVSAIGSIIIAKIDPRNWKKSKRILFFEQWLKALEEWRLHSNEPIEKMWERGIRLREFVQGKKGDARDGRPWVDEYVAKATGKQMDAAPESEQQDGDALGRPERQSGLTERQNSATAEPQQPPLRSARYTHQSERQSNGALEPQASNAPVRSNRYTGQTDHVALINEWPQDSENRFADQPPSDPSITPTGSPVLINPFEHADDERALDSLFPNRPDFEHGSAVPESLHPRRASSRRVPSSVYSESKRLVPTPAITVKGSVRSSSIYSRRTDDDAYRGSGGMNGSRASERRFV